MTLPQPKNPNTKLPQPGGLIANSKPQAQKMAQQKSQQKQMAVSGQPKVPYGLPGGNLNRGGFWGAGQPIWGNLGGVQGSGPAGTLRDIFSQGPAQKNQFDPMMERAGPFIAASLANTQGYQGIQQAGQQLNPMQAFGQGAGQIAQGATEATTAGQNQLARAGLGRSAGNAAVASQATQGAAGQTSDLFNNLYQQSLRDKFAYSQTAFDTERMITSLALGMNPTSRALDVEEPDSTAGWLQAAGGLGANVAKAFAGGGLFGG